MHVVSQIEAVQEADAVDEYIQHRELRRQSLIRLLHRQRKPPPTKKCFCGRVISFNKPFCLGCGSKMAEQMKNADASTIDATDGAD